MQPTTVSNRQLPTSKILATFSTSTPAKKMATMGLEITKGQRLFTDPALHSGTYLVTSGEVLILRNGRPVDLVEAGEILSREVWSDADAVALTTCTLETIIDAPPDIYFQNSVMAHAIAWAA